MAETTVDVDHDVGIVPGMRASTAPEIFDINDDSLGLRVLQVDRAAPSQRDTAPSADSLAAAVSMRV